MAIPDRFTLADVDGVLCVRWESTDYSEPRIVANYWPTVASTYSVLRHFFDHEAVDRSKWPELLAKMDVKQTYPGEYFIGVRQAGTPHIWQSGHHVGLVDGAHTAPVKTETREAPVPKRRAAKGIYWSAGNWVIPRARGVERVNPLTV